MKKNVVLLMILLGFLAGSTAWAQSDPRAEFSFNLGWTFSDGVSGDPVLALDGNVYDRVDPKDSFSWGFTGEYLLSPNSAVGFLYDRQQSKLEISGPSTVTEVDNMAVDNYHGIFTYNFGDPESMARPFVFGGIGATHYSGVTFTAVNGAQRTIGSQTQFSGSIGAGFKYYPAPKVGLKLQARWTPTYIKSDPGGVWCDPYWGCYAVGNAQYSNQFEMTGGVCMRF